MKKYVAIIGLLISSFIMLIQCTKYKENTVGSELFQRDNWGSEIYSLFQAAPSDTSYQTSVSTEKSLYLFVGGYHGNMSRSLIQFSMADIPDTITVDSAIVTLYVNNVMGSSVTPFVPTVHQITGAWEPSEITWDNFEAANITGNVLPFTAALADTDSVLFTIPPALVQSWIDTTDQTDNNGILINYTSLDTGSLVQYYSGDAYSGVFPKLTLFYNEGTTQITKDITSSEDAYISNSQNIPGKNRLFVLNSIAFRSLVIFNIDTIPADATINRAMLILHADTTQSFPSNNNPFYIYGYPVTDLEWPIPLIPVDSSLYESGVLEENSDVMRMNITTIVECWKYELLDVNAGILLAGRDEQDNILQRSFYSTTADSALRPSLEIFYSTPPSNRM